MRYTAFMCTDNPARVMPDPICRGIYPDHLRWIIVFNLIVIAAALLSKYRFCRLIYIFPIILLTGFREISTTILVSTIGRREWKIQKLYIPWSEWFLRRIPSCLIWRPIPRYYILWKWKMLFIARNRNVLPLPPVDYIFPRDRVEHNALEREYLASSPSPLSRDVI